YSRFPIRAGGNLVGYVHAKDILDVDPDGYDRLIPRSMHRPMPVIPAALPIAQALAALQRSGAHIGRVTDGARTVGAITMEDLLSELIGGIDDVDRADDVGSPK